MKNIKEIAKKTSQVVGRRIRKSTKNSEKPTVSRRTMSTTQAQSSPQKPIRIRSNYSSRIDIETIRLDTPRRAPKQSYAFKSVLKNLFHNSHTLLTTIVIVLCAAFAAFRLVMLTSEPVIILTSHDVVSTDTTVQDKYKVAVNSALRSSVFNSNKLTIQKNSIEESIVRSIPEFRNARVTTDFLGRRPVIELDIKKPMYILKQELISYVVMDDGTLLNTTDVVTDKMLPEILDDTRITLKSGAAYLRSDDVTFMRQAQQYLEQGSRRVQSFTFTAKPRELELRIEGVGYYVKMYLNDKAQNQMGSLFAFEAAVGRGSEPASEYIDVRAGEKVYWK